MSFLHLLLGKHLPHWGQNVRSVIYGLSLTKLFSFWNMFSAPICELSVHPAFIIVDLQIRRFFGFLFNVIWITCHWGAGFWKDIFSIFICKVIKCWVSSYDFWQPWFRFMLIFGLTTFLTLRFMTVVWDIISWSCTSWTVLVWPVLMKHVQGFEHPSGQQRFC